VRGSRIKRVLAAVCATAVCMGIGSAAATADTTHVFLEYIEIPGAENVEPVAVDKQGNLLVWLNGANHLAKFDTSGNPVNFSGLGTHIIDGAGSFDCPKTPSDCDQVPTTNGFQAGTRGNELISIVAVDHSGGPADGYIYILNNYTDVQGRAQAEVDVFDETGIYLGKIDQSQVTPARGGLEEYFEGSISVASNGVLYVTVPGPRLQLSHVDRYVPVDGDPAHTQFAGQIRAACANAVCAASAALFSAGAGGRDYFYAYGYDATKSGDYYQSVPWMRFPMSEFHRPGLLNFAVSEDFSPDPGPFGNGGVYKPFGGALRVVGVDPENEHVFLGEGWGGFQEWDQDNQQVGPMFGNEGCPGAGDNLPFSNCKLGSYSDLDSIAFDRTGGPDDGNIYVRGPGTNQIAVFSPPVTIPDINGPAVTAGHYTAEFSANIGLAGGPSVTDCRIEWGFDAPTVNTGYSYTTPCDQTAFASATDVSAEFTGLFPETEYHYRVAAENANGTNKTDDMVFRTVAVLGVQTDPATNLDRTSGELNGSLNPDGMNTSYFFEYGSTTQYNNRTPERNLGSAGGQQSVPSEAIDGLQAGRTYHFRLVAKNELGKTKGQDRTFLVPANPSIAGVQATNVAEREADLNARINPLGFDTTYYFEYGPTLSYGNSTPEVTLGSQLEPQPVSAHIDGYEPGLINFRVIAENQWGKTITPNATFTFFPPDCPNAHVRQQTDANYLPDCRAYELVSPGNAGSATLFPGEVTRGADGGFTFGPELAMTAPNAGGSATSPPRFGFIGGEGAIPGMNVPNGLMDRYVATRTTSGWVTTYPGRTGDEALIAGRPRCSLTMDICLDYRTVPPLSNGGTGSNAPYIWDIQGRSLGRWPTNLDLVPNGDQGVADDEVSADFQHYVFSSVNTAFAPGGQDAPPGTVYDNDISDKRVVIASVKQNGEQIPRVDSPSADPDRRTEIAAVSTDGSHILMAATTNPACNNGPFGVCPSRLSFPAQLYMRVDGALTYEVSPGATAVYQGMTSDGSQVFFTSEDQLTVEDSDGSVDLYAWREATDSVDILSQGNGKGDADDCTAQWASACDVKPVTTLRPDLDETIASQSGDIYFYSPEQLDPERPGVRNERNLYVFRNGAPRFVSTMDPGIEVDRMQISPDGSHMAFLSRTQATAYVNIAPDDNGTPTKWREMYVFEPNSGEIVCASCIPSGEPPTILTTDTGFGSSSHNHHVMASLSGRFMSDDRRVGFATADALVSTDTNQKIDVYEFVNNGAHLITSGTDERDTQGGAIFYPTLHTGFEGISRDGNDLYFSTFETFVPEDLNGSFVKFYDARTGGGFPARIPLLPCTAADECHGDTSVTAPQLGMGTLGDLGSGGNHPVKKKARSKRRTKRSKKQKRGGRHKRHQTKAGRNHG
jgi:hypothetical protein